MTSQYFIFDNINSIDMGLHIVRLDGGFFGTPISGGKSIISEKIPQNDVPYRYRVDLDVMKFSITFSPLDGIWTDEFKFQIFKWLNSRNPKSFQTCDSLKKMCYVTCVNPQEVFTAGLEMGYITMDFEATTPYWLSPIEIATYDLSDIGTTPTIITMENRSNVEDAKTGEFIYYPEIQVTLVGNTNGFVFYNLSNANSPFGFSELTKGETIYVNNQRKQIISNISPTTYRLSNMLFDKRWFSLIYGLNRISVVCTGGSNNTDGIVITTKCQFPIYM
jgi:phage-related protein